MSSKVARKIRKGYNAAGAMYWTADMEKMIRKLRTKMNLGWSIVALETVYVIFFILKQRGVF